MPGKIDSPLNKMLEQVEWGEFKLGNLFNIENTLSFNKDRLTDWDDYDYVTRTSLNQGILQSTWFVNSENLNESWVRSLWLLQMDFFFRRKKRYAWQFIRKIIPKFNLSQSSILFFSVILNWTKNKLLSVLVRDVDDTFRETVVKLPIKNGTIDFEFIDKFIAELEAEHQAELEAYLKTTGLKDYELTSDELGALNDFEEWRIEWKNFNVIDVFNVKNTWNILSRDIVENSWTIPYLCASSENNWVSSYITYDEKFLDKGNCIFIGWKTFVVSYQETDFYSNDSHNLVLYLKDDYQKTKLKQLYLACCINKSLWHRYTRWDSISNKKIQKDVVLLPIKNNQIDYERMEIFISAIQKLVIKDVVIYNQERLNATAEVINN